MSLNSSLRELGELIAENLTIQGVSSTYDEGLTTLANKILDIEGGGSSYDRINLTADKSILSYYDSETAVLTAQLTKEGSSVAISGVPISWAVDGVETQTINTDNNGQASFTYNSTGAGDILISASNTAVSTEIYSLEDCKYYHDMTSANNHWTIPSNATATYSSQGMKIQANSWADLFLEVPITKPASIEYDMTDYTGTVKYGNYFWDSTKANRYFQMYSDGTPLTVFDAYPNNSNRIAWDIPVGAHVKINIKEDTMELYVDDVLKLSKTYTMGSPFVFGISTGQNRSTTYQNVKIKPIV